MRQICVRTTLVLCVLAAALPAPGERQQSARYEDFASAIRANDLAALRNLARVPGAVRVENSLHATPLHYAAIYGSLDALSILLGAGADMEARNQQQATPLLYAAWSEARTKLLVNKGARINVAAKDGTTPLMIAASAMGNTGSVRYLLEHGANAKALDAMGDDALMRAAWMSDSEVTGLLLRHGADAHQADQAGLTALQLAQGLDCARIRLLLQAGADVNSFNTFAGQVKNGPIALTRLTPLMVSAPYGDADTIGALLKAGARVNDVDVRKMTPLMLAIGSDQAKPTTVKTLIAAGADVNALDQNGESALDWAHKFGNPEIISALEGAGARGRTMTPTPHPPANAQVLTAAEALTRILPLLARTGSQFFREGGGCNGCHHQPMEARAFAAAAGAGIEVDESVRQPFRNALVAERPAYFTGLPLMQALPGDEDRVLASLLALADLQAKADAFTDAAVHYVALRQHPSGAWVNFGIARPPLQDSAISRTGLAIRALRVYGWPARRPEFEERIERARRWLASARPVTTYEEVDRIMGLQAAGVAASSLEADAKSLLAKQRADGGWAQTPYLDSDAYATGLTLKSLYDAGLLRPDAPAYRSGIAFLLRTQFPDGSWYVRSRSPKFQPFFQSGFPFDHDQWISSAGTAWAAMALAHAVPPSRQLESLAR